MDASCDGDGESRHRASQTMLKPTNGRAAACLPRCNESREGLGAPRRATGSPSLPYVKLPFQNRRLKACHGKDSSFQRWPDPYHPFLMSRPGQISVPVCGLGPD